MTITRTNKLFRVVAISKTANPFGLSGHVLVACDGEAYEVGRCRCGDYPEKWTIGQDVNVPAELLPDDTPELKWAEISCEIPRRLPTCPAQVLAKIFK